MYGGVIDAEYSARGTGTVQPHPRNDSTQKKREDALTKSFRDKWEGTREFYKVGKKKPVATTNEKGTGLRKSRGF